MSALRQAAEEYLAMRRCLGYKLQRQGPLLLDFIGYLERAGATTITIEAAITWATLPSGAAPVWHKHRLIAVRGFAAHLKTLDPNCQVPPRRLLPTSGERVTPYLYSEQEIAALVHAAGTLARPLQAATYQTLISLLAVTGLRAGEAIRLTRDDVNLDTALIAVINSKFGKSRLVPLHPVTVGTLRRYTARRDELCPAPAATSFFISTTGKPLLHSSIDSTFARLLGLAGICTPPGQARPRVHDLRHAMAVRTLLEWYRSGADVPARLTLATQTGLRVSELTSLTIADAHLGTGPHVYCQGKGRKERCTPLTATTVAVLASWLTERGGHDPDPLFCTRRGSPLSRDAVERLLAKHITTAARTCPSLQAKTVSPHTLRHSAAMALLHSGVDITVIALWLGHESPASTRVYMHADMEIKERALARTTPPDTQPSRYNAPDNLLAFLDSL